MFITVGVAGDNHYSRRSGMLFLWLR